MRIVILLVFFLSACGNDARQGYETIHNLIENENLRCPSPSYFSSDHYGISGVFFICKFNEGPFVYVNEGRVSSRGQYITWSSRTTTRKPISALLCQATSRLDIKCETI